ncbi:ribonuclease domain-containing protein [Anaeropeptidivorans aminofermentans]|uniref:ribonuclease domain-containing protein n=1 Tax=Anaeropeptidivorans aminofermentans TaxID=2934315 RepID=UPI0020249A93|nr:ribonuclease domain-containing protein [Anaeropeptidivorans aminofermentans]
MEGLSSVTNYFAAKSSNAFNALQKMEEVDKYFKEEFLQGAEYGKEIKVFYVSNNKALEAANAIGIRDGKGPEGAGNVIKNGSYDDLPDNAQKAYNGYEKNGWKGNFSGQTQGTAAGSKYNNFDSKLPTTNSAGNPITYKEFDVNNYIPGATRDAQRFLTGSDGSIYYTSDHYSTFIKIK